MAEPPSDEGSDQLTRILPVTPVEISRITDRFCGGLGTVAVVGVIASDKTLWIELPAAFVAYTVNVYGVPFVRPMISSVVESSDVL
jgi:hypothetical protein